MRLSEMGHTVTAWLMALLVVALTLPNRGDATELTIVLDEHSTECFFEEVTEGGVYVLLEYQVIYGGRLDIDAQLISPSGNKVYASQKKQYDQYGFTADEIGEYKVCFGNEFSTFAHKTVYFDFQVGPEDPIIEKATALTLLESSTVNIHEALVKVHDFQTHHRLTEASDRDMAETLNDRVQAWSMGQAVFLVAISVGQVLFLRRLFDDHNRRYA